MSIVRKSYTEKFKHEAFRLAKERGNLNAAARESGHQRQHAPELEEATGAESAVCLPA